MMGAGRSCRKPLRASVREATSYWSRSTETGSEETKDREALEIMDVINDSHPVSGKGSCCREPGAVNQRRTPDIQRMGYLNGSAGKQRLSPVARPRQTKAITQHAGQGAGTETPYVCIGGRGEPHRMDPSTTDRGAGLREKVAITKSVCSFSTADSAMDLSIRSTVGSLIFQSRGRGPSIFTCSNFSEIIKDQCVRPTHIQLTKPAARCTLSASTGMAPHLI
ncbi:hypothetical protein EYF80_015023 [Liparis tanakae]|uniref:Uncharacterized protein n=1 Tax=Liparis tanakae TaxID=230148 RepID=A0A4Z2IB86_9TELE|nr:hypothetical protein EYF80_015023 [Liparis tanakae]